MIVTATTDPVRSRPGTPRSRRVVIALVTIVAIAAIAALFSRTEQTACFGCGGPSAQVTVTAASLRSADFKSTNTGILFTCGTATGSFLTLFSTGPAGEAVIAATISWVGQTNRYSLKAGSTCLVGAARSAGATQNLLFATKTNLLTNATAGGTFTGSVTLVSGALLIFTGTFQ